MIQREKPMVQIAANGMAMARRTLPQDRRPRADGIQTRGPPDRPADFGLLCAPHPRRLSRDRIER
jgi:hypothetical protein